VRRSAICFVVFRKTLQIGVAEAWAAVRDVVFTVVTDKLLPLDAAPHSPSPHFARAPNGELAWGRKLMAIATAK
jgi:hypothetical protein